MFHKNHESLQNIINGVGVVQPITNRVYPKNAYLLFKDSSWIICVYCITFSNNIFHLTNYLFLSNLRLKGNIKINTF